MALFSKTPRMENPVLAAFAPAVVPKLATPSDATLLMALFSKTP